MSYRVPDERVMESLYSADAVLTAMASEERAATAGLAPLPQLLLDPRADEPTHRLRDFIRHADVRDFHRPPRRTGCELPALDQWIVAAQQLEELR